MSSEVSIVVRAVDMTRAAFGRVRNGLASLRNEGKAVSKGLGIGGLFGGVAGKAGGAFLIGYAAMRTARAYADAFKEAADNARKTGNYAVVSENSIRRVDQLRTFMRDWRMFAAMNLSKGIDLFGQAAPSEGVNTVGAAEQQRIADARASVADIARQRAMRDNPVEFLVMEEQRLAHAVKEKSVREDLVKLSETEAELARVRFALEGELIKQNEDAAKERERQAKDEADRIEELSKERAKADEERKTAAQKAFSERIEIASQQLQSDGLAFIASGRGRRITREQSAAMGQRIREMTGDDPAKFQQQTAFTLQQIYRLLGGGSSGKE